MPTPGLAEQSSDVGGDSADSGCVTLSNSRIRFTAQPPAESPLFGLRMRAFLAAVNVGAVSETFLTKDRHLH